MRKAVSHISAIAALALLLLTAVSCDQTPADASLNITSPKNGDRWMIGEPNGAQIAWENNSVNGNVILALVDGNESLVTVINDSVSANERYYYWTVPDSIPPAAKYHVLITSEQRPEITSMSGAVRIEASSTAEQSLTITYPSNNDEWQAGKANGAQVRWEYAVASGYASLTLCKSGDPVLEMADSVSIASGLYLWTVPDTTELGNDYTVYIESLADTSVYDYSRRFKIVKLDTSQHLDLLEPDGKTIWQVSASDGAMIRWDANRIEGTVKIDLYQQSDLVTTIADSASVDSGKYVWTVPTEVAAGNGYQVYIEANADHSFNDISSRFRIDPYESNKSIEITTPSGGDRWDAGATNGALTEWESTGLSGTVHLELYLDGDPFLHIGDGIDVLQSYYTWTVPSYVAGGNGFEVYIESDEDSLVNDFSSSFRINPSELSAVLEVTAPKSGVKWQVLEENGAVIEWTSENLYDSLHIDLYHDGLFLTRIAEHVPVLDHTYTWTVPIDIPGDRGYQVYIESDLLPLVNDLGSSFTVEPSPESAVLEITSPKSGNKWEVLQDSGAVIEWTSENLEDSLRIDLYHDGEFVTNIAENVPVLDHTYTWTVPIEIQPGHNYQVYIESNLLPLINDFSSNFMIEASEFSPTLEVETPHTWVIGDSAGAIVEWSYENLEGTVNIQLLQDQQYVMDIASGVPVDSLSYAWTVPNTVEPGRKFEIYIESVLYPTVNDISRDFRIDGP